MLAALISAICGFAAEATPYFSELGKDSAWTTYDVNGDSKTWSSSTDGSMSITGTTNSIKYSYHSSNAADDWYISPAIHLEAGKEYKLKIWQKSSNSYAEKYRICYATGNSVADLSAGTEIFDETVKNSSWTKRVETFTVSETGDYYFGIYCHSDKNMLSLYLTGFSIAENVFAPAGVSNLKVTPGADRALEATLSWTLPTTDSDGATLPEDAAFDAVTIYRDGAEVMLLDGTATTWTDSANSGLTSGYHKYEVMVTVNGYNSAKIAVNTPYIGPVEAFSLPYSVDFPTMDQAKFDLFWIPATGRNQTTTANWKYSASSYYGNRFEFYPGTGKRSDNWLISPQMKFEHPGVYRLMVKMQFSTGTPTNVDFLFGQGTSIGGYENVIGNLKAIPSSAQEFYFYVEVTEPGEYGFAVHNDHQETSWSTYYIYDFAVEEWQILPIQISDLSATVDDNDTVTLSWTNPSLSNIGTELPEIAKVEVYRNNELAATLTDCQPGAQMTYNDTPGISGVITYHLIAYNANGAADGTPVKVTTSWVGDETQSLPYQTTFENSDVTRPIWSTCDANADGISWRVNTSAKMDLDKTRSLYRNDDYLLAPYMNLAAGYYKVTYNLKGGAKNKNFGVGIVSDKKNTTTTYTNLATFKQTATYTNVYEVIIKVPEAGKYAVALYNSDLVDSSSESADEVTRFSIAYLPVLPEPATDLEIVPAADLSLSATLTWINPTATNIEGVAAENLTKGVIKRNGEIIAEVTDGLMPGEESQYTDADVPEAGCYNYSVEIYNAEGCSTKAAASAKSPWIGGGKTLPYICDNDFDRTEWTIFNVNGDKRSEAAGGDDITWEVNSSYVNITSSNNTPDDWLISPRLTLEDNKQYILSIGSYTGYGYQPVNWDLHIGASDHYTDMLDKLATINTAAELKANHQIDDIYIRVKSGSSEAKHRREAENPNVYEINPGVYTIGLHANNKGSISLNKFSLIEDPNTGIEGTNACDDYSVTANKVMFATVATDIVITDMQGRVIRSEAAAYEVSLSGLSSGAYLVSANCGGKRVAIKVII